ncbi:MAG: cation:proton antiporter, partial [Nanoarchaeota archaeon]
SVTNILIFVVALILLRFLIFPHILRFFESAKSNTSLFSGAIIIALLTATLSNLLGLGIFIGALFSGLIIRQILLTGKHPKPWEEHSIAKSVHLISFGFLVPIFFVSAGLRTDLFSITSNINLAIIFLAIALLGTLGGSILGVMLSKGSFKEGLTVGFGISSRGDIEIVISSLALQAGLFTIAMYSSIILMSFLTTLISPIMFRYLSRKYSYVLNVKH